MRPVIAYLHLRQPIVRGLARYTVRLKAKTLRSEAGGYKRAKLPINPKNRRELLYWHAEKDRIALLEAITREVSSFGLRYRIDAGWRRWDLEVYGSRYLKVRLTTVTERYSGNNLMTRVRVRLKMSTFCKTLLGAGTVLAAIIGWTLWPFSVPSLFIPVVWAGMYWVNRLRVAPPVMGLIDEAAEKAGFVGVYN